MKKLEKDISFAREENIGRGMASMLRLARAKKYLGDSAI